MTGVLVVTLTLLAAAGLLTVVRLLRGPSVLDRVVAMDTLLSVITCGLATAAGSRRLYSRHPGRCRRRTGGFHRLGRHRPDPVAGA